MVLLGNHWCLFMLVNVDWRQLWHLVKNTRNHFIHTITDSWCLTQNFHLALASCIENAAGRLFIQQAMYHEPFIRKHR